MLKRQSKQRRRRGVFLSHTGWQRLQAAEHKFEVQENQGVPSTLETLSAKTGLSPNTITKVRRQQAAVDRQTLEIYFNAFDLALTAEDYQTLESTTSPPATAEAIRGQVPLNSPFYISRPPLESLCYETMQQPGALLHVRAPQQTGKTSLVTRTLLQARENGLTTLIVSMRLADSAVTDSLENFLRWFCAVVTRNLGLKNQLSELWDPFLGNSFNCTAYFEQYLLAELDEPLILVLDDVDSLFEAPDIAVDFFSMLRVWHEIAKYGNESGNLWKMLRLILVHSHQIYSFDDVHVPLNFGVTLDLPNFTQIQISDLIERYGIGRADILAPKLAHFLGGRPNLVQLTLHALSQKNLSIEELMQTAVSPESVFADHLLQCFKLLERYSELLSSMRQLIQSNQPILLPPLQSLQLVRLGLATCQNQKTQVHCQLYRAYFDSVLRQ
ncbi:MAG: hypothetical protein F6J97_05410 [Leptolyngbya sp. SIO4C1]|nr:hypothetical protein [Leptolyngbya sp. SIO4C1]